MIGNHCPGQEQRPRPGIAIVYLIALAVVRPRKLVRLPDHAAQCSRVGWTDKPPHRHASDLGLLPHRFTTSFKVNIAGQAGYFVSASLVTVEQGALPGCLGQLRRRNAI
nr:hypothetical protein [Nitrosomonas sp. Nm132]